MTSLNSFKELLLKKAEGNSDLQTVIRFVNSDVMSDLLMESLEKMARARSKGTTANASVMDFGTEMDPANEPHMIREALGHHVSNYKAALYKAKTSTDEKERILARQAADQHARQALKIMDLADRVEKHSHGKLNIDYVPTHPWERNILTSKYDADHKNVKSGVNKVGDWVTDTKGIGYKGTVFGKNHNNSFLEMPPHESYLKEVKRHGHNGAYPFEHVKINGDYIPIEDVEAPTSYKEHPFDKNPIMGVFRSPAKHRKPEEDAQYIKDRDKYNQDMSSDPNVEKFWSDLESKSASNPQRGKVPSAPVHKQVENPLDLSKEPAAEEKQQLKTSMKLTSGKSIRLTPSDVAHIIMNKKKDAEAASQPAQAAATPAPEAVSTPSRVKMSRATYNDIHSKLKAAGLSDDHLASKVFHNTDIED
jgi:hypothetical protein